MFIINKWIDFFYRIATGKMLYKLLLAPVVGLLYLAFIGFFIFISIVVDKLLNFPALLDYALNSFISMPVIIAGFFLMQYSIFYFVKIKGTPVPLSPPPKLVIAGPYAHMRNPMLTGIFIQLFGLAVLLRSISLFCIFTPLFIIMNVWELKKIEEPELEKRMGKDYSDYKKKVPMFFPRLKK